MFGKESQKPRFNIINRQQDRDFSFIKRCLGAFNENQLIPFEPSDVDDITDKLKFAIDSHYKIHGSHAKWS